MTKLRTASEQIAEVVTSWPGVTAGNGHRGEFSFKVGRREIGHLHGDHGLHIGFPKAVWHELHEQGRIDYHPVFPGRPGYASRRIEGEDDVRDAVALLRVNYDRAVARHGQPQANGSGPIPGLHSSPPQRLPFAPSLEVRAFLLERAAGNVLVYSVDGLEATAPWIAEAGGVSRRYLNHWHEAMFNSGSLGAPLFVHEADRAQVAERMPVRATFSRRHTLDEDFEVIPVPGHTPGATAYVWDSGSHRFLFTGDTIHLDEGEWVATALGSSDRASYTRSLELIRELHFDVLVPWAATGGQPCYAVTTRADARRRIGAILERVRRGEER